MAQASASRLPAIVVVIALCNAANVGAARSRIPLRLRPVGGWGLDVRLGARPRRGAAILFLSFLEREPLLRQFPPDSKPAPSSLVEQGSSPLLHSLRSGGKAGERSARKQQGLIGRPPRQISPAPKQRLAGGPAPAP